MDKKTLDLATQWLEKHKEHVQKLIENTHLAIKPTGADLKNPALWKAIHWNWFLIESKINITEKKKWYVLLWKLIFGKKN